MAITLICSLQNASPTVGHPEICAGGRYVKVLHPSPSLSNYPEGADPFPRTLLAQFLLLTSVTLGEAFPQHDSF